MKTNNIKKVLELGAGHGRDSIFFASNGLEVEALDYSAITVEILGAIIFHLADIVFKNNNYQIFWDNADFRGLQ